MKAVYKLIDEFNSEYGFGYPQYIRFDIDMGKEDPIVILDGKFTIEHLQKIVARFSCFEEKLKCLK